MSQAGAPQASLANLGLARRAAMLDFEDGRLPEARARLTEIIDVLATLQGPGVAAELAAALNDRATVLRHARRPREAIADLERGEALCATMPPFPARMARLGIWHGQLGLLGDAASAVYDPVRAAALLARLHEQGISAWWVEEAEATLAFQARDWARAARLSEHVADLLAREGWRRGEVAARARAANAWLELGEAERAAPAVQAALDFFAAHGPPDLLARARLDWARVLAGRGQLALAWQSARAALDEFEYLIRQHRALGDQQRYLSGKMRAYAQAFAVALELPGSDSVRHAWEVAERAKSFYLCQMLANAGIALFEGVDPELIGQLARLEEEQDALEAGLRPGGAAGEARLAELSGARHALLDRIMRANPRWAATRHPPPFDLEAALGRLPAGWSALSFYWQDDVAGSQGGARLHLFHGRDGRLTHLASDWSGAERAALDAACAALRTTEPFFLDPVLPEALARKLLPEALDGLLARDVPLLVTPHGPLRTLPLAALPLPDGEPLVARCPLRILPSLALLPLARDPAPAPGVLLLGCAQDGFGHARLPGVSEELAELDALWRARGEGPTRVDLPEDGVPASAGAPLPSWAGYALIHLACHGTFDPARPLDAALYLGRQALRVSELFAARLCAELVCLSACDLGAHGGRIADDAQGTGDEWLGMVLPLLTAGARGVLASLWAADSDTARAFMGALHQGLARGASPEQAYRKAMLAMRGRPAGFWANWQLVGFPSSPVEKEQT